MFLRYINRVTTAIYEVERVSLGGDSLLDLRGFSPCPPFAEKSGSITRPRSSGLHAV